MTFKKLRQLFHNCSGLLLFLRYLWESEKAESNRGEQRETIIYCHWPWPWFDRIFVKKETKDREKRLKQWFRFHFLFDSEYIKISVVAKWWLKSVDKPPPTRIFFFCPANFHFVLQIKCVCLTNIRQRFRRFRVDWRGCCGYKWLVHKLDSSQLSIYSEPCRYRQDSPFAARSLSTDTPNATWESTWLGRDSNQRPFADHASTRATKRPSHKDNPWD